MESLYIVWSQEYETGIPILDEQYRGLVSLINSFFFYRGDSECDITKILVPTAEMFKSYAKINFMTIEKLMILSEYPKLKIYQSIHEEMLHKIYAMDKKCRLSKDAQSFLLYLKEYWLKTIQFNRMEYFDYLVQHFGRQKDEAGQDA